MKWAHNDHEYETVPVDWDSLWSTAGVKSIRQILQETPGVSISERGYPVVYNTNWDKCFELHDIRVAGNTNQLSAWLVDVYDFHKCCVSGTKFIELVVKR